MGWFDDNAPTAVRRQPTPAPNIPGLTDQPGYAEWRQLAYTNPAEFNRIGLQNGWLTQLQGTPTTGQGMDERTTGGATGGLDPFGQPRIIPNPEFDRFYQQWKQANPQGSFSQFMDAWNATQPARTPGVLQPVGGSGSSGTTTGGLGEDPFTVFQELMAGKPITLENMQAIEAELTRRTGASLEYNARGNAADLRLPNGMIQDVVIGFEGPLEQRRIAAGEIAPPGGFPAGGGGGAPGTLGSLGAGGNPIVPYGSVIQEPTGTDDPGFAFAMEEGQKALERSAAARGTLLTGGTLKDLARYSTGMALQGYGDAWNRRFAQQGAQFGQLFNLSTLGLNAASGYGGSSADLATGAGNAQAAGTATRGSIWGGVARDIGDAAAGAIAIYRNRRYPMDERM